MASPPPPGVESRLYSSSDTRLLGNSYRAASGLLNACSKAGSFVKAAVAPVFHQLRPLLNHSTVSQVQLMHFCRTGRYRYTPNQPTVTYSGNLANFPYPLATWTLSLGNQFGRLHLLSPSGLSPCPDPKALGYQMLNSTVSNFNKYLLFRVNLEKERGSRTGSSRSINPTE